MTNELLRKLAIAEANATGTEFEMDEAERAGAFMEDALHESDAVGSNGSDGPSLATRDMEVDDRRVNRGGEEKIP